MQPQEHGAGCPVVLGVVSAALTVKIGEPFSHSRSIHGEVRLMQLTFADGYDVFRARVKKHLESMRDIVWGEASPILVKPSQTASQARYEELGQSDEAMAEQVRRIWAKAARRKAGQGAFRLELFVYVQNVGTTSVIRRATESRVTTAAAQIDNHLAHHPGAPPLGPAARSYWAIQHARQRGDAPLEMPTNTTFSQLGMIDQRQGSLDAAAAAAEIEPQYVTIRCKLNGGTVPLQLHLADLRQQLGLPLHALTPPFRAPVNAAPPTVNTDDVDHAESDNESYIM